MMQFLSDHPILSVVLLLVFVAICILLQRASEKRSNGDDEDRQ